MVFLIPGTFFSLFRIPFRTVLPAACVYKYHGIFSVLIRIYYLTKSYESEHYLYYYCQPGSGDEPKNHRHYRLIVQQFRLHVPQGIRTPVFYPHFILKFILSHTIMKTFITHIGIPEHGMIRSLPPESLHQTSGRAAMLIAPYHPGIGNFVCSARM